jgi:hypothetical protein
MTIEITDFEFTIFFILTIILLITKATLSIYLGRKLLKSKKETGKFKLNFITAFFFLMVCLFISRLVYMYFDFFLTRFDPELYYEMPNVLFWKIGSFFNAIGLAIVLYTLDKTALKFKLKGILAYVLVGFAVVNLLFPVNSQEDFTLLSAIGIFMSAASLMVLVIFLYIGIKIPGLRKPSFFMLAGLITYAFGGLLYNEFIVTILINLFGGDIRITAYSLFVILKIIGLVIVAYSVTKFSI